MAKPSRKATSRRSTPNRESRSRVPGSRAVAASEKTPSKTPSSQTAGLRVGNPGNAGGTGRPTSEIRDRCKGSFYDRIRIAEEIADNPDSSATDRLRALDLLGKYAGLQHQTVEHSASDSLVDLIANTPRVDE